MKKTRVFTDTSTTHVVSCSACSIIHFTVWPILWNPDIFVIDGRIKASKYMHGFMIWSFNISLLRRFNAKFMFIFGQWHRLINIPHNLCGTCALDESRLDQCWTLYFLGFLYGLCDNHELHIVPANASVCRDWGQSVGILSSVLSRPYFGGEIPPGKM